MFQCGKCHLFHTLITLFNCILTYSASFNGDQAKMQLPQKTGEPRLHFFLPSAAPLCTYGWGSCDKFNLSAFCTANISHFATANVIHVCVQPYFQRDNDDDLQFIIFLVFSKGAILGNSVFVTGAYFSENYSTDKVNGGL